ncbi:MAG: glycosyltransferase [Bacteroidales bacterium]|nr:glycosyltransferase [Bacteroidales bacterium]
MALPILFILLLIYAYSLLIMLFYLEIEKEPGMKGGLVENPMPVSIIIPFRNESDHLPGLLDDFLGQTCPVELWELIFVNDHSEDGSASELQSLLKARAPGGRNVSVISLPSGIRGKKAALAHGIARARYERIIQVDGDCRLGSRFLASHIHFQANFPSDLIAGMVSPEKGNGGFLEAYESLDMLSLMGSAAGSFGLGRPMMCSGANLSYSKKLYEETRIFDPRQHESSGDDMFLMIGARKLGRSLAFNTDREALVVTGAVKSLRSLINQRIRWGSKSGRYSMPDIQLLALLVALTNTSILLMPLWFFLYAGWWPWLAGALFLKSLADFLLLYRITGLAGQLKAMRLYIPVTLAYYPIFLITVLGALKGKADWK